MRNLLLIAFLFISTQSFATTYYFGATSAGSANGTSPANRWGIASIGWATMTSGDTLLYDGDSCAAGSTTCRMNINSTSANYSATNKLIIDFNNKTLDCQYGTTHCLYIKAAVGIYIKNLTISGATADGIRMDGSDGTIGLHDVTLYNVRAIANKQCGFAIDNGAYNVTLDRVVGAYNYDSSAPGNSDGMCTHVATSAAGSGNIIRDSEFYYNSDDGIDLFQTNNAFLIQRVYSHDNGYIRAGVLGGGDGRGIVLGPGTGAHIVESSIFTRNAQFGIHRRDNSAVITLRNNTVVNNGFGIGGGNNITFPSTIDLNFPTSQTRFTDSGVNTEYRAISQPVSSLSVGAQSYSAGTVGALAANQYGYSAPYVYIKGNPGTATVTATPTTQSSAYNNISLDGTNTDSRTGLTTASTNSWDLSLTTAKFKGGFKPNYESGSGGFRLGYGSGCIAAGTNLLVGNIQDFGNRAFRQKPSCGAWETASGDDAVSRTTRN